MEQYGLIIEDKNETAIVSLQKHLACEKCGRCGILSGSNKRETLIEALNPVRAGKGQRVLLESDDRLILFISFMLYLVPLGGLVAGIFSWLALAEHLGLTGSKELASVGAGFLVMAVIYLFIRSWDKRVKGSRRYMPVITGIINDDEAGNGTGGNGFLEQANH